MPRKVEPLARFYDVSSGSITIDGVEKSYSYSELALLRIEIETAVKERGAFEFHDQQEITFVKTLIPDHKDEWKLNQVESAGLVTLQALK